MTQEEKAKLYDETIERAKRVLLDCTPEEREVVEYIYPELEESKDEKIRKELIEWIEDLPDRIWRGLYKKDILAWLEKQGKQKSTDEEIKEALRTEYEKGRADVIAEMQPFDYENATIVPKDFVPKAKPKFKVGDWVVFNNQPEKGSIYQVEKIENFQYTLRHILGGSMPLSYSKENMLRFWTIQDAEDGDVLVSSYNQPFIYNDWFNEGQVGAYCGLNIKGEFIISYQQCNWTINKNIKPATQEQRNILFQKIKEADCKWDSEEKEVMRIY